MPGTPSPDVVIVGGGVIGAAIAYHLARRGAGRVLVLERDTLGSGSTSKNAGGIRLQFSSEINVRLSQRSLPVFEDFERELGIDIQLQQVGYLFLITQDRDALAFERSLELWQRLGVPARRLDQAGIREIFPELVIDDVRFATFCGKDGHADPTSILNGYVSSARAAGVEFREHVRVSSIELDAARVAAVRADGQRIACGSVINAAGAWAPEVAKTIGVDLPIRPLRRQIFVTDPVPLEHPIPLTVEFATSFYLHRESGGILMGMADRNDEAGYSETVNWDFLPAVVERGLARLPLLEHASVRTGWAGLYEDTPDKHPILGATGVDGSFVAAGFSGHGVMHAPAVGELMAELIVDGRTSLDISALRLDRFSEGRLVAEHNVI